MTVRAVTSSPTTRTDGTLESQRQDSVTPIGDQPWGMREFTLTDPSGNHLRIGHEIPTAPLPLLLTSARSRRAEWDRKGVDDLVERDIERMPYQLAHRHAARFAYLRQDAVLTGSYGAAMLDRRWHRNGLYGPISRPALPFWHCV